MKVVAGMAYLPDQDELSRQVGDVESWVTHSQFCTPTINPNEHIVEDGENKQPYA